MLILIKQLHKHFQSVFYNKRLAMHVYNRKMTLAVFLRLGHERKWFEI